MTAFKTRPAARLLLAHAVRAARGYDGSETSAGQLIDALAAFERLVADTNPKLPRDAAEKRIARRLGSSRPANVNDLLDMAVQHYERRFAENRIAVAVTQSPFAFVPTDGPAPMPPGPEPHHKFERPRISPRTSRFLAALTRPGSGVFLDDIRVVRGQVQDGAMRTEPYTLIQLPRHNREVLICDQVGNVSFVGEGIRGEVFWATYRKEQLKQFADITPVVNGPHSDAQMIDLILADNPPRAKVLVGRYIKTPLTEDIILIHALRYAAKHDGELPSANSDAVEGLPGENWHCWNSLLRVKGRGLSRPGVKGLGHLYNIYNLKAGHTENSEAVKLAIKNLEEIGAHGLVAGNLEAGQLSEDIILIQALRYAKTHNGELPAPDSGNIEGMPGQNWNMWDSNLRSCVRGLTREGVKGLGHLFIIYGLKIGKKENTAVVMAAIEALEKTGTHGLTAEDTNTNRLTEDLILTHALLYAKKNKGKLPTFRDKIVEDMPSQTWAMWENAIRNNLRGLSRPGIRGLSHLFNIYNLKTGQKENPETVDTGIKTLEETGHHGLHLVVDRSLSELTARRRGKFAQPVAA